MWTGEVLQTEMTYWQSPLLFSGLFDFFALWLASDVPSAETPGELRYDNFFSKLTSFMEHLP